MRYFWFAFYSCSWSTIVRTTGESRWPGSGLPPSRWSWWSAQSIRSRVSTTSSGTPSWPTNMGNWWCEGYRMTCHCRCPCSSDCTSSAEWCCCTASCSRTRRPAASVPWTESISTRGSCWKRWWPYARARCCSCLWCPCG